MFREIRKKQICHPPRYSEFGSRLECVPTSDQNEEEEDRVQGRIDVVDAFTQQKPLSRSGRKHQSCLIQNQGAARSVQTIKKKKFMLAQGDVEKGIKLERTFDRVVGGDAVTTAKKAQVLSRASSCSGRPFKIMERSRSAFRPQRAGNMSESGRSIEWANVRP